MWLLIFYRIVFPSVTEIAVQDIALESFAVSEMTFEGHSRSS